MASDDKGNGAVNVPGTASTLRVNITPQGREALRIYEREIATYLRELPRLLAEGYAWHYTLIKGDEVLGVWEDQDGPIEMGRDKFGDDPIFVKKIDPRDTERFGWVFAQLKAESCPS